MSNFSTVAAERSASATAAADPSRDEPGVQAAGFLLELSLDWMVIRASENVSRFFGESHVSLIEEPLSRFVQAQPLHHLRNLFSRLSGTTGIARAYQVRLTEEPRRFDIAFQLSKGRVLLEGLPSPEQGLGEAMGTVGGLIEGLPESRGSGLLEAAARRVRALTGYDRAWVDLGPGEGDRSAESSRGDFPARPSESAFEDLPAIVADSSEAPVPIFPRKPRDEWITGALLRAPTPAQAQALAAQGVASSLRVPIRLGGGHTGLIQCDSRSVREPSLEVHAAAELYAQMLAMRLEIDRSSGG